MWKGMKKRGSDGLNSVFGMLKSSFSVVKIFHTAARFWHGRKGSAPAELARTEQEAQAEEREREGKRACRGGANGTGSAGWQGRQPTIVRGLDRRESLRSMSRMTPRARRTLAMPWH